MNLAWWSEHPSELPLLLLTAVVTHLLMSFSQTLMHYGLGHRRLGGIFFRNHIQFHHVHYSKDHLSKEAGGVQTLPALMELMRQRLPCHLLIAGAAGVLGILLAAGEVSNWDVFLRFVYQVPYGQSDPLYGKDIGFYLFSLPMSSSN
jgi:uncharacterized membrane protein (UPF0182 family)